MQFKLAHSFSPLKIAPMSHGELQQQGAKVPFSSSFGIKEFSHDTSFIHCLYDKDNQLILLLTPKLWCSQMRNFTRQMFSTNISMLKKNKFLSSIWFWSRAKKKYICHRSGSHATFRTQANKMRIKVTPPAISLGWYPLWHISCAWDYF